MADAEKKKSAAHLVKGAIGEEHDCVLATLQLLPLSSASIVVATHSAEPLLAIRNGSQLGRVNKSVIRRRQKQGSCSSSNLQAQNNGVAPKKVKHTEWIQLLSRNLFT